ncbi:MULTISPECIES: glutathione S-transferase family protein [Kordiimonas]|jgi:glutathione S-transferase|uniref:glutathione S-transferase family protein n=1 Tax=Kordiimonas TaxID=288021 RepID=UPI00257B2F1D|nr:glutathione S-transferase family protein [Kordiimonas sp. UBA4487]
MPIIKTQSDLAGSLKGLHLFHFAMSNCSQRVRLLLEEKGLEWKSHHVDLSKNEHAAPWYQAINPAGLVPTLVHDGRVIVESVDIILYLEDCFQANPLAASGAAAAAKERDLLRKADDIQGTIKLLSHEFLFKPKRQMSLKQVAEFEKHHRNRELVEFSRAFSKGFDANRIGESVKHMQSVCEELEQSLVSSGGQWLLGDMITQADLTWIVNIHRLDLMRWNFSRTPMLRKWLDAFRDRPSFRAAVRGYEPVSVRLLMKMYAMLRQWGGSGVQSYQEVSV